MTGPASSDSRPSPSHPPSSCIASYPALARSLHVTQPTRLALIFVYASSPSFLYRYLLDSSLYILSSLCPITQSRQSPPCISPSPAPNHPPHPPYTAAPNREPQAPRPPHAISPITQATPLIVLCPPPVRGLHLSYPSLSRVPPLHAPNRPERRCAFASTYHITPRHACLLQQGIASHRSIAAKRKQASKNKSQLRSSRLRLPTSPN